MNMSLKNLLFRSIAMAAVSAGALFAPLSGAQAAEHYVTVEPAQPSDTTGKIEVLEFFAYTCPHCNTIEPMVEKWAKTLPDRSEEHTSELQSLMRISYAVF